MVGPIAGPVVTQTPEPPKLTQPILTGYQTPHVGQPVWFSHIVVVRKAASKRLA